MNNKQKFMISLSTTFLVILVFIGLAYALLRFKLTGEKNQVLRIGDLELKLEEKGNTLGLEGGEVLTDEEGLELNGFDFSLKNNDTKTVDYIIYLDDVELDSPTDVRLDDKYLKYSLDKNGNKGEAKLLTDIGKNPDRILEQGKIGKNQQNDYTLRLWVTSDVDGDITNQVFKAKIRVENTLKPNDINIENNNIVLDLNGKSEEQINLNKEKLGEVSYKSMDSSVVNVSEEGMVTAVGIGNTDIEVTSGTYKDIINVKVQKTVTATYKKGTGVTSIDKESDSCVLKKKEDTCKKELPTIVPEDGYNVLGWSKKENDTEGITGTITFQDNVTYYTATKKAGVDIRIVFHLNGAKSLDGKTEDIVKTCTAEEGKKCTITSPTIEGSDETPNVIGFSTTATNHKSSWGQEEEQEVGYDAEYYAQTKSPSSSKTVTVTMKALDGVSNLSAETKKCASYVPTYNGVAQTCIVVLPTATVDSGYIAGFGFEEDNIVFRASEQIRVNTMKTEQTLYVKPVTPFYRVTYQKTDGIESMDKEYDSCTLDGASSCTVQLPNFVVKKDYFGAWSTSSSKAQDKADIGSSITLTGDITYYAYSVPKKLTVVYAKDDKVISMDKTSDSCDVLSIDNPTCTVQVPNYAIRDEDKFLFAWSTSSTELSNIAVQGQTITLTKNTIYYPFTVQRKVTVTYHKKERIISVEKETDGCEILSVDEPFCTVQVPQYTVQEGYIAAWSTSDTSLSNKVEQGDTITLKKDMDYYEYSGLAQITVTYKSDSLVPIEKTTERCELSLTQQSCKITLPHIYSTFEIIGWSEDKEAEEGLAPQTQLTIYSDKTYYALAVLPTVPLSDNIPLRDFINDLSVQNYQTSTDEQKKKMYVMTHRPTLQQKDYTNEEMEEYRYIGSAPDNYVTFNNEEAGWRVIGVFTVEDANGKKEKRIKLMRDEPLYSLANEILLSWDNKCNAGTAGINGSNWWGDSRLMMLLNPGYESDSLAAGGKGSLYWNRQSGKCPGKSTDTIIDCIFTNAGLTSTAQEMIGDTKWYLGGIDSEKETTSVLEIYQKERGNKAYGVNAVNLNATGKEVKKNSIIESIAQPMINAIANTTRGISWTGKVGLIYKSDYGYATGGGERANRSYCLTTQQWSYYQFHECSDNDWLSFDETSWSITPFAGSDEDAMTVAKYSELNWDMLVTMTRTVRPTVYLSSDVTLKQGTGKKEDPFVFELKS